MQRRLVIVSALAAAATAGLGLSNRATSVAHASSTPAECYKVPAQGNPFADEHHGDHDSAEPSISAQEDEPQFDIWCYRDVQKPAGARLVYKVDEQGRSSPEMTIMVEADGTLRHASLASGTLTVHRLRAIDFNPLNAPLTPPEDAERITPPIGPSAIDSEAALELFQEHEMIQVRAAKVTPGTVSVSVPDERLPWAGYWYPYSTRRMYNGDESVMAKYDQFIARRAAQVNIGSQAWERRRHSNSFSWAGHCNGWAAASIMAPEPRDHLKDPYTGLTFTPFDLKGLWMERHYCPKIAFYGTRNYGRGENPRDIHARTFHNVLTYFVGDLKKPVAVDIMAGRPVQNSVISGYTMKIRRIGGNSYHVLANVKVHLYDEKATDNMGVARFVNKRYEYTLTTNSSGYVTSGGWISGNPDFIWVPVAPGECKDRNQAVDQFWLDEIYRVGVKVEPPPTPTPTPSPTPRPRTAPRRSATPAPST